MLSQLYIESMDVSHSASSDKHDEDRVTIRQYRKRGLELEPNMGLVKSPFLGAKSKVMNNTLIMAEIAKKLPVTDLLDLRQTCTLWNNSFVPQIKEKKTRGMDLNMHRVHVKELVRVLRASLNIPLTKFQYDCRQEVDDDVASLYHFISSLRTIVSSLDISLGQRLKKGLPLSGLRRILFELAPELVTGLMSMPHVRSTVEATVESPIARPLPALSKLKWIDVSLTDDGNYHNLEFTQMMSDVIQSATALECLDIHDGTDDNGFLRPILSGLTNVQSLKTLNVTLLVSADFQILIQLATRRWWPALTLETFAVLIKLKPDPEKEDEIREASIGSSIGFWKHNHRLNLLLTAELLTQSDNIFQLLFNEIESNIQLGSGNSLKWQRYSSSLSSLPFNIRCKCSTRSIGLSILFHSDVGPFVSRPTTTPMTSTLYLHLLVVHLTTSVECTAHSTCCTCCTIMTFGQPSSLHHFIAVLFFVAAVASLTTKNVSGGEHSLFEALNDCLVKKGISDTSKYIVPRDSTEPELISEYDNLNFQWNLARGHLTPFAYFLPVQTSHVSAAVRCATRLGVRIVPRSGGHSFLKYGFDGGDKTTPVLVIDLRRMNAVHVPLSTLGRSSGPTTIHVAHIEGGAQNGHIQHQLFAATQGVFYASLGVCPTVGIGFTLGGGFGYFSRLVGLGSDNLLAAEMVTANGTVVTANSRTNTDLYWALRGGGGGNFGIVTNVTVRIYPEPAQISLAVVSWPIAEFVPFFLAWQTLINDPSLPARVGSLLAIKKVFSKLIVVMHLYSIGGPSGTTEVEAILATYFALSPPTNVTLTRLSFSEFLLHRMPDYSTALLTKPEHLATLTRHPFISWIRYKSMHVEKMLPFAEMSHFDAILSQFLTVDDAAVKIEQYGGAINALAPSDTAFVHRGRILYHMTISVNITDLSLTRKKGAKDALQRFFDETKPLFDHTESYQNYLDEYMPDYLQRYHGANLERLVDVKARYDPDNVFRHPSSIPVRLPQI